MRTDEWYNFRSNPRGNVHVLAALDEATYSGGKMGVDHPIAWCQQIDGGRSWYTAMRRTSESYAEPSRCSASTCWWPRKRRRARPRLCPLAGCSSDHPGEPPKISCVATSGMRSRQVRLS